MSQISKKSLAIHLPPMAVQITTQDLKRQAWGSVLKSLKLEK
jgi:hypothetical protein